MRLPKQAKPVERSQIEARAEYRAIKPSDLACDLCLAACNQLSGAAKTACIIACDATVC